MKLKNFFAKLLLLLRGKKTRGMTGPAGDAHSENGNKTILDEHLYR